MAHFSADCIRFGIDVKGDLNVLEIFLNLLKCLIIIFKFQVVDQYLPDNHVFLGHVFIQVHWANWLSSLPESMPLQIRYRVHQCLLILLVKLSNEPNIRNNHGDKIKNLLVLAEGFNWTLIDPDVFQQVLDWYVMSCDPLVILKSDPMNLDVRVLK